MHVNDQPDLNALMARLGDGDRSAFGAVFRLLWPPTLRLCLSMLKNDADANDAAQQGMEKVFSRASDYDPSRHRRHGATLRVGQGHARRHLLGRNRRRERSDISQASRTRSAASSRRIQEDVWNRLS